MEAKDVSLKVMRLSRPLFQDETPIFSEEGDLVEPSGENQASGLRKLIQRLIRCLENMVQ